MSLLRQHARIIETAGVNAGRSKRPDTILKYATAGARAIAHARAILDNAEALFGIAQSAVDVEEVHASAPMHVAHPGCEPRYPVRPFQHLTPEQLDWVERAIGRERERWARAEEEYCRRYGVPHASTETYGVLGLPFLAPLDEVRRRWRELAFEHHPDRGGDEASFIKIKVAYEAILKQPQ